MDACHGTKKQGDDTGNFSNRGGRKVCAMCAHHSAAEMPKAQEIPTVELLWLYSEHCRGIKQDSQCCTGMLTALPSLILLCLKEQEREG